MQFILGGVESLAQCLAVYCTETFQKSRFVQLSTGAFIQRSELAEGWNHHLQSNSTYLLRNPLDQPLSIQRLHKNLPKEVVEIPPEIARNVTATSVHDPRVQAPLSEDCFHAYCFRSWTPAHPKNRSSIYPVRQVRAQLIHKILNINSHKRCWSSWSFVTSRHFWNGKLRREKSRLCLFGDPRLRRSPLPKSTTLRYPHEGHSQGPTPPRCNDGVSPWEIGLLDHRLYSPSR